MENRTPDLVIANDALYQLSYDPTRSWKPYNRGCGLRKRKEMMHGCSNC